MPTPETLETLTSKIADLLEATALGKAKTAVPPKSNHITLSNILDHINGTNDDLINIMAHLIGDDQGERDA